MLVICLAQWPATPTPFVKFVYVLFLNDVRKEQHAHVIPGLLVQLPPLVVDLGLRRQPLMNIYLILIVSVDSEIQCVRETGYYSWHQLPRSRLV